MKFAVVADDSYFECYKTLLVKGHTLIGAWLTQPEENYGSNTKLKSICDHVKAPILGHRVEAAALKSLIAEGGLELLIVGTHPNKIPTDCLPKYHMNIHPSLLPEGRGPSPVPNAILRDHKKTGITFHKITDKLDEGDILLQSEVPIEAFDTHDSLTIKTIHAANKMMAQLADNFAFYWENAKPQTEGSYWKRQPQEEREIDWNMSVKEIDTLIRAYGRFGVRLKIDGKLTIITHALCWPEKHDLAPGTIVAGYKKDIAFACKDGFVCLSQSA